MRLVHLALPHLEQSAGGRIVAITSLAAKEPTRHLALSNTFRPGAHRLAEDARRRARPARDHRQLRRTRPHRDASPRVPLSGRPDRGGTAGHSAAPLGRPARVRRRRLLRRVRPGALRHGTDDRRRRRPAESALLDGDGSRRRRKVVGVARRARSSLAGDRPLSGPVERLPAAARCRASGRAARDGAGRPRSRRARAASTSSTSSSGTRACSSRSSRRSTAARRSCPANLIVPPGVSDKAARQADLRAMTISQKIAAAVALRRLGYKIAAKPTGVIVAALAEQQPRRRQAPAVRLDRRRERRADALDRAAACAARESEAGRRRSRCDQSRRRAPHRSRRDDRRPAEQEARDRRLRAGAGRGRHAAAQGPDRRAATSAARPQGSRSRSRCWRSSATTSTAAIASPRPAQIELNGAVDPIGGVKQKTFGARAGESGRLPRARWG